MHHFLPFILVGILTVIGPACKEKQTYTYDEVPELVDFPGPRTGPIKVVIQKKQPQWLHLADEACNAGRALPSIDNAWIWANDNGTIKKMQVPLIPSSGRGLKSKAISEVLVGVHVRERLTGCQSTGERSYTCARSVTESVAAGTPIQLCSNTIYPVDSLENLALVAVAGIGTVYRAFRQANPKAAATLSPLKVMLLPKLEKIVEVEGRQYSTIPTDNAYWLGRGHHFHIGLLPHSKSYLKNLKPFSFYHQLSVIGHEYGHHIFRTLGQHFFVPVSKLPTRQLDKLPIDLDGPLGLNRKSQAPANRRVGHSHVISTLNEGFADYLSYHALKGAGLPTKIYLGSKSESRDVASPINADGKAKRLSFDVLKHFFSSRRSAPSNRSTPNHQDVHTLGAVYAHSMSRYFSTLMQRDDDHESMLGLASEWVQRANMVAKQQGLYPKSIFFMEDLFEEGIRVASRRFQEEDQSCKVLQEQFPVFYTLWALKDDLPCSDLPGDS